MRIVRFTVDVTAVKELRLRPAAEPGPPTLPTRPATSGETSRRVPPPVTRAGLFTGGPT